MPVRVVERRLFDPAPTGSTILSGVAQATGSVPAATVTSGGRESLVYGAYKPTAATTGTIPGISRTIRNTAAALVADDGTVGLVAGKTYSNQDLYFILDPPTIPAGMTREQARIFFRNGEAVGPATAGSGGFDMFKCWDPNHCPITVTDFKVLPRFPHPDVNGFRGWDFEAYRCDLSGCIDSFQIWNTQDNTAALNVKIKGCWSHDHCWFSNAQAAADFGAAVSPDGPHGDDVQIESANGGCEIIGNNFGGDLDETLYGPNAFYTPPDFLSNGGFTIAPDVGDISGLLIQKNWLYGGGAQVNISHKPNKNRFLTDIGIVNDNVFGRDTSRTHAEILRPTSIPIVCDFGTGSTANTFEDNGATVPLSNGG